MRTVMCRAGGRTEDSTTVSARLLDWVVIGVIWAGGVQTLVLGAGAIRRM